MCTTCFNVELSFFLQRQLVFRVVHTVNNGCSTNNISWSFFVTEKLRVSYEVLSFTYCHVHIVRLYTGFGFVIGFIGPFDTTHG
jgi:hypothetical protein